MQAIAQLQALAAVPAAAPSLFVRLLCGPTTNLVALKVEINHFRLREIEPCFLGRSACSLSHYTD
jgi:hypothetical protein